VDLPNPEVGVALVITMPVDGVLGIHRTGRAVPFKSGSSFLHRSHQNQTSRPNKAGWSSSFSILVPSAPARFARLRSAARLLSVEEPLRLQLLPDLLPTRVILE